MKAHKHAEMIKAWADGAEVQFLETTGEWRVARNPQWGERMEYRIKPAEPERVYPVTQMTGKELDHIWCNGPAGSEDSCVEVANAALRHACDAGQVVPRDEFDRAVGDRKARDMAVARAVREAASKCMSRERHCDRISEVMDINLARVIAEVRP